MQVLPPGLYRRYLHFWGKNRHCEGARSGPTPICLFIPTTGTLPIRKPMPFQNSRELTGTIPFGDKGAQHRLQITVAG